MNEIALPSLDTSDREVEAERGYMEAFRGRLTGAMSWDDLDALWNVIRTGQDIGWYIYAVGEAPPDEVSHPQQLARFLEEVTELLHREHQEDYCGIVYTDNFKEPSFVKIYDPNNLGVVCGYSEKPPLPGWTLSRARPVDLNAVLPPPGNRRRWWQRLFA